MVLILVTAFLGFRGGRRKDDSSYRTLPQHDSQRYSHNKPVFNNQKEHFQLANADARSQRSDSSGNSKLGKNIEGGNNF